MLHIGRATANGKLGPEAKLAREWVIGTIASALLTTRAARAVVDRKRRR